MILLRKRETQFLLLVWAAIACSKNLCVTTLALASNSIPSRRTSIVTGGNGFVGREIIQVLLQQHHDARSTSCRDEIYCLVRPSRVEEEIAFWKSKSNQVRVMPYDMLDGGATITKALIAAHHRDTTSGEGGEDGATMQSCVYHVASVFGPSDNHIQTAKDNVKGTEDLVNAMANFPKNTRLVLTSSMAAVRGSGQDPSNGQYYTHQDWNTLSSLGDNNWGSSYQWSKAESERRAWLLATQHDIPMTSICPSFVFGPLSDGIVSNSYSIQLVRQWVRGESNVQSRLFVDIRDCAQAHVAAGTQPEAIGQRYIVSHEERVSSKAMAEALQKVCRATGLGNPDAITFDATYSGGSIPIGSREAETLERLRRDLGITLRPVQETISDMGRSLLETARK